jgi:hypothetical protein
VRCSLPGDLVDSENDYEFYMPGETVQVNEGQRRVTNYECQADGTWKEGAVSKPRVPGRVPWGTFTQVP